MDISHIIPDFPVDKFTDIILRLENAAITTSDILTLDTVELGKRAGITVNAVDQLRRLTIRLLHQSHHANLQEYKFDLLGEEIKLLHGSSEHSLGSKISTLDKNLDHLLGGGLPTKAIHEVVGPAGAGKTQWILSVLLSTQLLRRPSIYISTEHPLPTSRVTEILSSNDVLSSARPRPSLDRIYALNAADMETMDHILHFQLPIMLERSKAACVAIDSIAAVYRGQEEAVSNQGRAMSARSDHLVRTGALLRDLAREHDCAIIVSNQVADRLDPISMPAHELAAAAGSTPSSSPAQPLPDSSPANPAGTPPTSTPVAQHGVSPAVLSLDHQQRFFAGWGDQRPGEFGFDPSAAALKVPALGLVWTNQISTRIALHKHIDWSRAEPSSGGNSGQRQDIVGISAGAEWTARRTRRWARLVFSPAAEPTGEGDPGVEFEIWKGGLRSIAKDSSSK